MVPLHTYICRAQGTCAGHVADNVHRTQSHAAADVSDDDDGGGGGSSPVLRVVVLHKTIELQEGIIAGSSIVDKDLLTSGPGLRRHHPEGL